MVVLQERNFSWPAGRRASQGTPEFFQEEKKGVARFQFFLSYLSGFFIMAISISALNSRGKCYLYLPRLLLCKYSWKIVWSKACQCFCLQGMQKCKMWMQNCLLTQHSMTSIDWNWSHYLQWLQGSMVPVMSSATQFCSVISSIGPGCIVSKPNSLTHLELLSSGPYFLCGSSHWHLSTLTDTLTISEDSPPTISWMWEKFHFPVKSRMKCL